MRPFLVVILPRPSFYDLKLAYFLLVTFFFFAGARNLLAQEEGKLGFVVKVADFGLSRLRPMTDDRTRYLSKGNPSTQSWGDRRPSI
jgi:hypothetical protein